MSKKMSISFPVGPLIRKAQDPRLPRNDRNVLFGVLAGRAKGESCGTTDYSALYTDVRDPIVYEWLGTKVKEVLEPGTVLYNM